MNVGVNSIKGLQAHHRAAATALLVGLFFALCSRANAAEVLVSTVVRGTEPTPREAVLRADPVLSETSGQEPWAIDDAHKWSS